MLRLWLVACHASGAGAADKPDAEHTHKRQNDKTSYRAGAVKAEQHLERNRQRCTANQTPFGEPRAPADHSGIERPAPAYQESDADKGGDERPGIGPAGPVAECILIK